MSGNLYTIQLERNKKRGWQTAHEVLSACCFGDVNYLIREGIQKQRIKFEPSQRTERSITLLSFEEKMNIQDILLASVQKQKLSRTMLSDALLFAKKHPDVQLDGPIMFLHEPSYLWSGHSFYVCLDVKKGLRSISMVAISGTFKENCRFAFLTK